MRESDIRRRIVAALRPLDAQAVENPINPGTPDVEFIGGWVEIKYLKAWPKRASTPLRIHHFTAQQRLWIRNRVLRCGLVLVLVRVADDWLLFRGGQVYETLGTMTRAQMYVQAIAHWTRVFVPSEFCEAVKSTIQ